MVNSQNCRVPDGACVLLAACLLFAPGPSPEAATLRWTGLGSSPLLSEASNWDALNLPVDGDSLLFGGPTAQFVSVFDLTRSFASLSFASDAPALSLHVQGNGATLAFDGAGIHNGTAGSSQFPQNFYADAGSTGGSIVFSGHAGINLDPSANLRPVNLTALGGASTAPIGGRIEFRDQSATGTNTYDGLRADGASAAGATGGSIVFRDDALATRSSSIALFGGSAAGAMGGQASFEGRSRVEGSLSLFAGSAGGQGARAVFSGTAVAAASTGINSEGASSAIAGAEGVTRFGDNARMLGSALNYPGTVAGAGGARLEFGGQSAHDSSGNGPGLGVAQIDNTGAPVAGARGGATVFMDDAFVRGSRLIISNFVFGESGAAGTVGGTTEFRDRSRAGQVTLVNHGALAAGPGTLGGATVFSGQASAERADITSHGGGLLGAPGGTLLFQGGSTAGGALLRNEGGRVAGAGGGLSTFEGLASAGSATFVNAAGTVNAALGGATIFSGNATAGNAFIRNDTELSAVGGGAGHTEFRDSTSAQFATIDNQGSSNTADYSFTVFSGRATAGNAAITNFGGHAGASFSSGGTTGFFDDASAGAASIVNVGGGSNRVGGGITTFDARATAGDATISLLAGTAAGAFGGDARFRQQASAGSARFTLAGATVAGAGGGVVTFAGPSSAADASFTLAGSSVAGASGSGFVWFRETSSAGRAGFAVGAGTVANAPGAFIQFDGLDAQHFTTAGNASIVNSGSSVSAAAGGRTQFFGTSSAANSTITNLAGSVAGARGGQTLFYDAARAGDATFISQGSAVADATDTPRVEFRGTATAANGRFINEGGTAAAAPGGETDFYANATAGSAVFHNRGGTVNGAGGAQTLFYGNATAGAATLYAHSAPGSAAGGSVIFLEASSGGTARVIIEGGQGTSPGGLDISMHTGAGMSIGSIEGGGIVSLGSQSLRVGTNGLSTTFSGLIRDRGFSAGTGGSLTVIGAGALTLTGANTYTGATHIGDGINANSGKLNAANVSGSATGAGPVFVERGGTLGGSGFIAGPVTLRSGGFIAPGDPVTLTLRDSLTWDGGGVIRLVLGADSAGSDHLDLGALIRGADGEFRFDFVDAGIVVGESYELLHFDSLVGFDAGDFSFSGAAGSFRLENGGLAFTVAAVPEQGTAWLLLAGLLIVVTFQRLRAAR